ncbi:hypothetical protein [Candidatus Methylobacter oryzae]|uniref:Uncharacterized protein n=1 Tax=Candidatus Methylobacter oryzae TaxID=2497749 RepID=A0ABY3CAP4_9GAMM|nr:hypothetical protein [Candidatus Methylobacter oryzae]TRW95542.1 hypothetical protein EKO24_009825 [Candidatus Methylobacter oryzae]
MKKLLFLFVFVVILVLPFIAQAQNMPCSGKKGGISHCDGSRFVCNDGSYSRSHPEFAHTVDSPTAEASTQITRQDELLELDYQGFAIWLDCRQRVPVKFRYNAQHDTGSEARAKNFR